MCIDKCVHFDCSVAESKTSWWTLLTGENSLVKRE